MGRRCLRLRLDQQQIRRNHNLEAKSMHLLKDEALLFFSVMNPLQFYANQKEQVISELVTPSLQRKPLPFDHPAQMHTVGARDAPRRVL